MVQGRNLLPFLSDLRLAESWVPRLSPGADFSNQSGFPETCPTNSEAAVTSIRLSWSVVTFDVPARVDSHLSGSLADGMLLFIALGVSLAVLWRRLTWVMLGLQVLVLFPLFAVTDLFVGSRGQRHLGEWTRCGNGVRGDS